MSTRTRMAASVLVAAKDLWRVTCYQNFVDEAPHDPVCVADHSRMTLVPVDRRESYASLAAVIRAWIDRAAIAHALGLTHDEQLLLSQTVGYPKH